MLALSHGIRGFLIAYRAGHFPDVIFLEVKAVPFKFMEKDLSFGIENGEVFLFPGLDVYKHIIQMGNVLQDKVA